MNKVKDTRNQIIDAAQDLLQRQSISGVSFQELANRIGIKKGSLYYHFESKDALSVAILERANSDMNASFEQGKSHSPTSQLQYFINVFRVFSGPSEKICPGGAFAGEWAKLSETVQLKATQLLNGQIQGVKEIIQAGIESGEFDGGKQNPEALAQWTISGIQGALLTSRITGDKRSFENSMNIICDYLIR